MKIPIVLAADNNVAVGLGVTLESLLQNAKEETSYEIYLQAAPDFKPEYRRRIEERIFPTYPHTRC